MPCQNGLISGLSMAGTQHIDRRNAASKTCLYTVEAGELRVETEDGELIRQVALDQVREVRLAIEMAGQESQIVCRLKPETGAPVIVGSRSWQAPGQWRNRADSFGEMLRDLHLALEPHDGQIRYLEGQTLAFMMIMFGLGLALTVLGVFFFVVLFVMQQNPAGLFLLPVMLLGGWLARLFWPRPPRSYDPDAYRKSGPD